MRQRKRKPTDLQLVAHHEAAHAVVALALGRRVERVSIVPSRLSAGRCIISGLGVSAMSGRRAFPQAVERLGQNALIYLAGALAENELDPTADVEESGASDLWMAMVSAVPIVGRCRDRRRAYVRRMGREARTLVRSRWRAIRTLAIALERRRVLRRAEIIRILRNRRVNRRR